MRLDYISYGWRLLATGFSFAAFFGGGLALAVTAFPVIALTTPDHAHRVRRTQAVIHRSFKFFMEMLQFFGILTLQVSGGTMLRDGKGRLIIANHPTLLDVVILMSVIPRVQCIVKSELWHNRYLGGVVRSAGYIRNDLEPLLLLDACRDAIRDGKSLIIFPEGTRSRPGEPLHFRRGFANIALLDGIETQLVIIDCQPIMLSKGDPWWKIPSRKSAFSISTGDRFEAFSTSTNQYPSLAARQLTRKVQSYFTARLAHG